MEDEIFFNLLFDSFDSVQELGDEIIPGNDELCKMKVLRVMSDEVPKEDKQISFEIAEWEGIKPFILEFDI